MAYALNISEIQTVKEQINDELVLKAYLLEDSMFEDLGVKVTTDVENIDVCYLFNRKGLQTRPYTVGNVKASQLGKLIDNPAKVEPYYLHAADSIERYREKGPFNATNAADEAVVTATNLKLLSGNAAEDVRANFFFGNKANRSLPDTQANQVKLGLSLFDGIYTLIAKAKTKGVLAAGNGNLFTTGDLLSMTPENAYAAFTTMYGGLHSGLKKPEVELYAVMGDILKTHLIKGYMKTYGQLAPTVLQNGWKFAEMPNVKIVTSSAAGTGSQIIFTLENNLEFICDTRENAAKVRIGQVQTDLTLFDYQVNAAATTRIRDYSADVFAVNEQVNTYSDLPGQYTADVFTVESADESEGTVAVTSGSKDLYEEGDIITLTATPKSGFTFAGWDDGSTENPYNYKFTGGVKKLVANFEAE